MRTMLIKFGLFISVHLVQVTISIANYSVFNGRHIIVGALPYPVSLYVARNSSGHIVATDGIMSLALSWLSQRLKFTYSFLQVNDVKMDPVSADLPGFTYYLINGKCDMVTGTVSTIPQRFMYMDLLVGFVFAPIVSLIPTTGTLNNVAAIGKPFQTSVWVVLLVVIIVVIAALYFTNRIQKKLSKCEKASPSLEEYFFQLSRHCFSPPILFIKTVSEISTYVLGILFNQGGYYGTQNKFAIRILLSSWCLASFVLITAYTSLLISYILSPPHSQPLIESINDILKNPGIFPVVDKGNGIDVVISNAVDGAYKVLGDRLRANPGSLRCSNSQNCVDRVKLGSHVYICSMFAALKVMKDDYDVSKKCNLIVGKKPEFSLPSSWAFPKNVPLYKEKFAHPIAEMFELGLLKIWSQWYLPDIRQCLGASRKSPKSDDNRARLSLMNIMGAFVVLFVGYTASFISFVGERIICRINH